MDQSLFQHSGYSTDEAILKHKGKEVNAQDLIEKYVSGCFESGDEQGCSGTLQNGDQGSQIGWLHGVDCRVLSLTAEIVEISSSNGD